MKIENNKIMFESNPSAYLKEKNGARPNTAQQINGEYWGRFQDNMAKINTIVITNSETGESFERTITDIYLHFVKVVGRDDIPIWTFSWKCYEIIDY